MCCLHFCEQWSVEKLGTFQNVGLLSLWRAWCAEKFPLGPTYSAPYRLVSGFGERRWEGKGARGNMEIGGKGWREDKWRKMGSGEDEKGKGLTQMWNPRAATAVSIYPTILSFSTGNTLISVRTVLGFVHTGRLSNFNDNFLYILHVILFFVCTVAVFFFYCDLCCVFYVSFFLLLCFVLIVYFTVCCHLAY